MTQATAQAPRYRQTEENTVLETKGLWISTHLASQRLGISSKTLFRLRQRGLLKAGHHWVRKNPAAPSSDLLWQIRRCEIALGRL